MAEAIYNIAHDLPNFIQNLNNHIEKLNDRMSIYCGTMEISPNNKVYHIYMVVIVL